ncbi:MAG: PIN domain-containing protein [Candidatus Aerophobetes bacterium]|nr:PIN domain-containing protein [Candidatus Aerophobetes bacterium]
MVNYLLDTTIIIDYLRGKQKIVKLLKKIFSEGSLLSCCSINIIEVYAGMKEKEEEITKEFLNNLEYYYLTKDIAEKTGRYKGNYQKKGVTLSLPDAAIVTIAIHNNLTLLTDNVKQYPMPELKLRLPEALSKFDG